jgi:hypothetical protein
MALGHGLRNAPESRETAPWRSSLTETRPWHRSLRSSFTPHRQYFHPNELASRKVACPPRGPAADRLSRLSVDGAWVCMAPQLPPASAGAAGPTETAPASRVKSGNIDTCALSQFRLPVPDGDTPPHHGKESRAVAETRRDQEEGPAEQAREGARGGARPHDPERRVRAAFGTQCVRCR